jgi:hypothetical protein
MGGEVNVNADSVQAVWTFRARVEVQAKGERGDRSPNRQASASC